MLDRILGPNESSEYSQLADASTTTTTEKPYKKYSQYSVAPELLRSYKDEDTPADSNLENESYQSDGRYCTLTRISPDTVLKRCRRIEP